MDFGPLTRIAAAIGAMFYQFLKHIPSQEEIAQMGPERSLQMEVMGQDIAHWLDRMIIELRKWKKKIDYWHFEKQLAVCPLLLLSALVPLLMLLLSYTQPLRNLDREWQEEIDSSSMSILRSLLCFGLCLPKDHRTTLRHGQLITSSALSTPAVPNIPDPKSSGSQQNPSAAYPPQQPMQMQQIRPFYT